MAPLLALVIAGCAPRPAREPAPSPAPPVVSAPPPPEVRAAEGRVYQVSSQESLLTVLVFRGGPLARAGHNHVIASHDMTGVAFVPDDVARASFEVHVPVQAFTIDEPGLRALEGAEFSSEVPDSAREGTRRNLLGEAMLDGERFPEIVLKSAGVGKAADGVLAFVNVTVRGVTTTVSVPLTYQFQGDALRVQGELALKQTDVGLTPFSLFGGALRVEDEMRVKVSLVAHGG